MTVLGASLTRMVPCHSHPSKSLAPPPRPMRRSRTPSTAPAREINRKDAGPGLQNGAQILQDEESEVYDLERPMEDAGKFIDTKGAGLSLFSPGWLTQLGRLWGGSSDTPVAAAKPADIQDLLGGALFRALYKWMEESGPVYLLPTGPASSFLVISDPQAAKHVLRATDNPARPLYEKGLVAEVSRFLFGDGFAISGGDAWRVRRRAVSPSLHKAYLSAMLDAVFGPSAQHMTQKLEEAARTGAFLDMEACFSQLTLDVIGKAVFNYDFEALTRSSPLIQAVYTSLKETESRATDLVPIWKLPLAGLVVPRQRRAAAAVKLIRDTTERLIAQCKRIVDEEEARGLETGGEEGLLPVKGDPSVLRFLIASREEVTSTQLRDDLLSMLVAGHETTGSALTWTLHLLVQNPDTLARAQEEIDRVLGASPHPDLAQYQQLRYLQRCVAESMRLYPHPPVLLRRALVPDELPGTRLQGAQGAGCHDLGVQHPPLPRRLGRARGLPPRPIPPGRAAAHGAEHRLPIHSLQRRAAKMRGRPVCDDGGGERAGGGAPALHFLPQARARGGDDHRRHHPYPERTLHGRGPAPGMSAGLRWDTAVL
ncbi:CYP97C3 [Auxenochlorella protothecoides x Auxenochlorella symbiontica]